LYELAQSIEGFNNTKPWGAVYSAAQNYLSQSQRNGLWPDWTDNSFNPSGGNRGNFFWDACRTPWRVAWDYVWFGTEASKEMCANTISFLSSKNLLNSPGNVNSGYTMTGNTYGSGQGNSSFVGGFASTFMTDASYQSNLDTYYNYMKNKNEDYGYYAPTLQILYLLTLSGNTPNFYTNSGPVAPRVISAETNSAGTSILLSVNKDVQTPSSSQLSSFSLSINQQNISSAFASISLATPSTIQINLSASATINPGDVISISYSGTGIVCQDDNLSLATFADRNVTNRLAGNSTLLDDCEDGDNQNNLGGVWFTYNDVDNAGLSVITPLTGEETNFEMTSGGVNGSDMAAMVSFSLDKGANLHSPFVGVGTNLTDDDAIPFDISTSTGISFYHKGAACVIEVLLPINKGENANYDTYSSSISENTSWTKIELNWESDFFQDGWGDEYELDLTQALSIQWKIEGITGDEGELWLDNIVIEGLVPVQTEVDKTELSATITAAESLLSNATAGTEPGQYPQSAITSFNSAITTANSVLTNEDATQTEVDEANTSLLAAITTFQNSENPELNIDTQALSTIIAQAESVLREATIGTANGEYPQTAATSFSNAIATAEGVLATPISQTNVDEAVATLETAITTFQNSVINVNLTTLNSRISYAQDLVTNATVGTGLGEYPTSAVTALNNAIATANDVVSNPVSQANVNSAVTTLNSAITTFENSEITTVSENSLIASAEFENQTHFGTYWYTYNDNQPGGESVVTPTTSLTSPFTMTIGGANGTENAAKITFTLDEGTLTYSPFVGLGFPTKTDETGYDMTGSTGISFWHKGNATRVSVGIESNDSDNAHGFAVPAHTNWTLVEISWTQLTQEAGWGTILDFAPSEITKFQWQVQTTTGTTGEVWIDEVTILGVNLGLTEPGETITVDKSELSATITSASTLLDNSTSGTLPGQYPLSDYNIFSSEIESANTVLNNTSATQSEVDAANTSLLSAITTFQNSVNIDTQTLSNTIAQAQSLLGEAVIGMANGNYPQADYNTFSTAITSATSVLNNTSATQTQIDVANTSLLSAITTFQNSEVIVNLSSLTSTISNAQSISNAADSGTEPGQFPQTAIDDLNSAISNAQSVLEDSQATQVEVNSAVETLQLAITTFNNQVVPETNIDISILNETISNAQNLVSTSDIGNNEGQYPQSAVDELNNVIDVAIARRDNPLMQSYVDEQVTLLQNAITTFQNSINTEDIEEPEVDFAALNSAIEEANLLYSESLESNEFISIATDFLQADIAIAQNIATNNAATQGEVDEARTNLLVAIATFETYRQVQGSVNKVLLQRIIELALSALSDSQENPDNYNMSLLNSLAIKRQQGIEIIDNMTSTQTQVNDVTVDIYNLYTRFVIATTSIENKDITNSRIYPNPFTDYIEINTVLDFKSVLIVGLADGKEYYKTNIKGNSVYVTTSHFNSGTYVVSIIYANGSKESVKIIKE
jgi:hypothetical protein